MAEIHQAERPFSFRQDRWKMGNVSIFFSRLSPCMLPLQLLLQHSSRAAFRLQSERMWECRK